MSLAVALPLLVLLTGGGIAWQSYRASEAGLQKLSERLFDGITRSVVLQTRGYLEAAVPASVTLDPADVASVVADCIDGPLRHASGETVYLKK